MGNDWFQIATAEEVSRYPIEDVVAAEILVMMSRDSCHMDTVREIPGSETKFIKALPMTSSQRETARESPSFCERSNTEVTHLMEKHSEEKHSEEKGMMAEVSSSDENYHTDESNESVQTNETGATTVILEDSLLRMETADELLSRQVAEFNARRSFMKAKYRVEKNTIAALKKAAKSGFTNRLEAFESFAKFQDEALRPGKSVRALRKDLETFGKELGLISSTTV